MFSCFRKVRSKLRVNRADVVSTNTAPLSIRARITLPMSDTFTVFGDCKPFSTMDSAFTLVGMVSVIYINGANACEQ